VFKKSELVDVVGWDDMEAKMRLRVLASFRLIRPTREGFRKTPAFISYLRGGGIDPDLEAALGDDEPF